MAATAAIAATINISSLAASCPEVPQQKEPPSIVHLPVSVALYAPEQDEPTYFPVPLDKPLQDHLFEVCKEYGIPVEMALAVMETESRFQEGAVSKGGDAGLFQIAPINHDWLCETLDLTNLLDPKQNITAGVYMLSLFDYEDPHKRLMAYNCGEGRAKELWEEGITSTEYSREVVGRMEQYGQKERPSDSQANACEFTPLFAENH